MKRYRNIGIIGGVGSVATADFFSKLISAVPAESDSDYPCIILENAPDIPDRSQALNGNGPSPVPAILEVGKRLIDYGAEVLALPCNTAHAFFDNIQSELSVPVMNMVTDTASAIAHVYPHARRIGLLATTGTVTARVYDRALGEYEKEVIHVSSHTQKKVMEAIYGSEGLKAGKQEIPFRLLDEAYNELKDSSDVIIAGCTEIALLFDRWGKEVPIVDSSAICAYATVTKAQIADLG